MFKQRLRWSLGLRGGFRRGISADNPFGVHEYRNVIGNNMQVRIKAEDYEMNFAIVQVNQKLREVLNNLMQFYIYDFSEFLNFDVEENGKYSPYPLDDYFKEGNHHFAYLIKREEKYVGFVLVRLIEDLGLRRYSIAEFFILKKYRGEGMGKSVATDIFNRHKGPWEVHQIESNQGAQVFWKRVINECTKGQFEERIENGKTIQTFVS
ncbi:putative acetyltransferase [Paenibacillus sp. 4624]